MICLLYSFQLVHQSQPDQSEKWATLQPTGHFSFVRCKYINSFKLSIICTGLDLPSFFFFGSFQQRRKLDAVYLYMRSLMASNPFHSAKESLVSLFDENRKKVPR